MAWLSQPTSTSAFFRHSKRADTPNATNNRLSQGRQQSVSKKSTPATAENAISTQNCVRIVRFSGPMLCQLNRYEIPTVSRHGWQQRDFTQARTGDMGAFTVHFHTPSKPALAYVDYGPLHRDLMA